jgi:hypothetical protein
MSPRRSRFDGSHKDTKMSHDAATMRIIFVSSCEPIYDSGFAASLTPRTTPLKARAVSMTVLRTQQTAIRQQAAARVRVRTVRG